MKKKWHDPKYKRRHRRNAVRSLKKQLEFKEYRRTLNQSYLHLSKPVRKLSNRFKHKVVPSSAKVPGKPFVVHAPTLMCFIENPEGMAKFMAQLKSCADWKRSVIVNMLDVTRLKLNAITVLLSAMVRFKSQGIYFNGNFPKNRAASKLLKASGFFEHLEGKYEQAESYELRGSTIYTHGKQLVDPEFSQRLIESATQTIWNEPRRCPGLQRVFVELMHNTNNHASFTPGERHYWISVYHIKEERRAVFTFVDFGVGVFESLKGKPSSSIFYRILEIIDDLHNPQDNLEILRLIFEGELHQTATGQYYRGKGLPGIYAAQEANKISKFVMITNDVFFSSENNEYESLARNFSGTFVSWELSTDNHSIKDD